MNMPDVKTIPTKPYNSITKSCIVQVVVLVNSQHDAKKP